MLPVFFSRRRLWDSLAQVFKAGLPVLSLYWSIEWLDFPKCWVALVRYLKRTMFSEMQLLNELPLSVLIAGIQPASCFSIFWLVCVF